MHVETVRLRYRDSACVVPTAAQPVVGVQESHSELGVKLQFCKMSGSTTISSPPVLPPPSGVHVVTYVDGFEQTVDVVSVVPLGQD